jgi:hypothetical protein
MKSENLPHNDLYREHAAYSRTEDIHIYIIQIVMVLRYPEIQ